MSSKLPSQSFSSESLVKGMKAVANQQVKAEPEVKEMEAELQELMRQRAMLSPVPAGGGLTKENSGGASSAAYPTQHSTTTPGKTLKKSRVEISKSNSTAQITFDETIPGDISPPGSPLAPRALDLGQTGDSPDEIEVLREEYHKVVNRNADLEVQVKMLQDELTQMKISAPGCNDTENNEGTGEQGNPEVPASEEAARKRLQRICTPKADGNLLVPREIYEEWRKGGASRARLQETFANLKFDKAAFIAHVTLEIEERQSMKTTVHAEWASEEKMRDGMHMSAARIKAVKDYCEKHEGLTKFDKYEGKMLFWVEHEVTAQYESSKTRTRREQVNFDTDEPDSTLCAASAPMTLNMDDVRNMSLGGTPGAGGDVQPQPRSQPPVLPQLQKNEKPSQQILKYMEGINKRVTKTMELKGKYEAIDEVSRSTAQKAFVQKLTQLVDALENKQALINEVYSSGAVEGYTDEQETVLRDHYKEAMKVAQESVTMEARARSIPAKPKAVAAPASKAKAKAKVKAKAKASAKAEASPKAAPKRAARC